VGQGMEEAELQEAQDNLITLENEYEQLMIPSD
jgi:hypothetical protein